MLGLLLPMLAVLYAEKKEIHWPVEEASRYVRDWVQTSTETLYEAWAVAKFIMLGRH